jgi:hypothetical protein
MHGVCTQKERGEQDRGEQAARHRGESNPPEGREADAVAKKVLSDLQAPAGETQQQGTRFGQSKERWPRDRGGLLVD